MSRCHVRVFRNINEDSSRLDNLLEQLAAENVVPMVQTCAAGAGYKYDYEISHFTTVIWYDREAPSYPEPDRKCGV